MFMHVNAKYMTHGGDLMNNLCGREVSESSFLCGHDSGYIVYFVLNGSLVGALNYRFQLKRKLFADF